MLNTLKKYRVIIINLILIATVAIPAQAQEVSDDDSYKYDQSRTLIKTSPISWLEPALLVAPGAEP